MVQHCGILYYIAVEDHGHAIRREMPANPFLPRYPNFGCQITQKVSHKSQACSSHTCRFRSSDILWISIFFLPMVPVPSYQFQLRLSPVASVPLALCGLRHRYMFSAPSPSSFTARRRRCKYSCVCLLYVNMSMCAVQSFRNMRPCVPVCSLSVLNPAWGRVMWHWMSIIYIYIYIIWTVQPAINVNEQSWTSSS